MYFLFLAIIGGQSCLSSRYSTVKQHSNPLLCFCVFSKADSTTDSVREGSHKGSSLGPKNGGQDGPPVGATQGGPLTRGWNSYGEPGGCAHTTGLEGFGVPPLEQRAKIKDVEIKARLLEGNRSGAPTFGWGHIWDILS